jgi:thioredoxin-dependent peroxiredoxin
MAGLFSWLFSDPLRVGSTAPPFTLPDGEGHPVNLANLTGRNVVLVFYPGDDTPGCTKQLCEFRDRWADVKARGVQIFGVNPQSAAKHEKFRDKFHFPFPLLVDEGQKVAGLYHANGPFVKRTVYVIGPDGKIRFGERGMPPPERVLAACA